MERHNTYLKNYSHYTGANMYTQLLDGWKESRRILEEQGEVKIYNIKDLPGESVLNRLLINNKTKEKEDSRCWRK